jgi:release factor glutamine methyltransferase
MYKNRSFYLKKLLEIYDYEWANKIYNNILINISGLSLNDLILNNFTIDSSYDDILNDIINQHIDLKKPLAYIFNKAYFIDMELKIIPPILIPRQETMNWVYNLKLMLDDYAKYNIRILEIGTGSGAIALFLAKEFPNFYIEAIDISAQSIALSKYNKQLYNISNIYIYKSDLFKNVSSSFDIIVSNPPYIPFKEYIKLDYMVKNWESKNALFAKDNGFNIIKKIMNKAYKYINKDSILYLDHKPQLIFEIGYNQGKYIKDLFYKKYLKYNIYNNIDIEKDYSNNDRLVKLYI